MVAAYHIVEDCAKHLNVDDDDVFLLAVIEQAAKTDFETMESNLAATLYAQWKEFHVIPNWMENWAIQILAGRVTHLNPLKGGALLGGLQTNRLKKKS